MRNFIGYHLPILLIAVVFLCLTRLDETFSNETCEANRKNFQIISTWVQGFGEKAK